MADDEYMTTEQVANLLSVEVTTLYDWRYRKRGPKAIKLGSGKSAPLRYLRSDVDAWIKEQAAMSA